MWRCGRGACGLRQEGFHQQWFGSASTIHGASTFSGASDPDFGYEAHRVEHGRSYVQLRCCGVHTPLAQIYMGAEQQKLAQRHKRDTADKYHPTDDPFTTVPYMSAIL
eukprot:2465079-Amphidinium_carterae.1